MQGKNYCGMQLDWDYTNHHVDVFMPNYIPSLLEQLKFQQNKTEFAPHKYNVPIYGQKIQYATEEENPPLIAKAAKRIQQIVGSLLFYGRAVDPTFLVALGTIASQQNQPTEETAEAITQLLNYVATNPNATIRFKRSKMILHIHSDASYLSEKKARSRAAGHFYLASNGTRSANNGPIHTLCSIMRNVMASAVEPEIGSVFHSAQDAIPLRNALEDLGHPQPPTPIQTDNSTAAGFLNDNIKQKRTKTIDMRFYWVKDRNLQNQFRILWAPGSKNLADYFSKHHPASHHRRMRKQFLHVVNSIFPTTSEYENLLRGCHIFHPAVSTMNIHTSALQLNTYKNNFNSHSCT